MLVGYPLSSTSLKHADVRYKHIQAQYADGVIELVHVLSSEQHGNMLTKPSRVAAFEYHREAEMGME